jgi:hypothetical protein
MKKSLDSCPFADNGKCVQISRAPEPEAYHSNGFILDPMWSPLPFGGRKARFVAISDVLKHPLTQ